MPARNLSDEAVHDLAGALRGLPDALESLNKRVESAVSSDEIQFRLERQRHELEVAHRADVEKLREEQRVARRRTIIAIAAAVIIGFGILSYAVLQNRHSLDILSRATGPAQQQVGADQIAVLTAKFDCANEENIQQLVNAQATLLNKPTIAVFPGDSNCQPALQAALSKLAADEAAANRRPLTRATTTTTAPPRPSRGSAGGRPGPAGSSLSAGPATTQPQSSPTTRSPTTTAPPTPPSTTCITVPQIGPALSISVCRAMEQLDGPQEVVHTGSVRRF